MAPKCFHYARCMCGGQKKTQTNKKNPHIIINLYSDDLLFFPNTLNLIPSHKHDLRTDLLQGVGGTACQQRQATAAGERPAADHCWQLGWLLSRHLEEGCSPKRAHTGRSMLTSGISVLPPTLFQGLLRPVKSEWMITSLFFSFEVNPTIPSLSRSFCTLLVLTSPGNSRC